MKARGYLATLLALLLCVSSVPVMAEETRAVVGLRTDGLVEPLGIDTDRPSFSWRMESDATGAEQTAYRLTVEDEQGTEVWDSGIVESGESVGIEYGGEALSPQTEYTWRVSVTDEIGAVTESEPARFETSLLSGSEEAWSGAQWLGAGSLSLDASSLCVFEIDATLTIPEGSTSAGLILGADDFRMTNAAFNTDAISSDESYVRAMIDISGVTEVGGARICFYRRGWYKDDDETQPAAVIEAAEDLDALLNAGNAHEPHELGLYVCGSLITVKLDGTTLTETVSVNRLGDSSSYNSFPNLNCVGFMQEDGQTAVWKDYRIVNAGKYASGMLFGEDVGATYDIFADMDGLSIEGDTITVSGGVCCWADPSYGGAPQLRSEFELREAPERARLYVAARGIYDLYLNGNEVAPEEWFNPGSEEYDAIQAYNVYDVTDMLVSGENAIGAVLGEGWWTGQMTFEASNSNYYGDETSLMTMLCVRYADGSEETLVSSEDTWKATQDGAVRLASLFQGERYDATREQEGWTLPGYDASDWKQASVIPVRAQFAGATLKVREDKPVHVIRTLTAKTEPVESLPGTGAYRYDMGEDLVGVPVITIPAAYADEGRTLTIRYAETLYPELDEYTEKGIAGTLMVENYRAALVTDFYTMKDGEQVFIPDLTFHGYRYIEITGLDEPLPADCVGMYVLSSLDPTAEYETSNELADRLFANIVNSTTGNYLSIPTDCPQRNERMGWTGDAQVFALSGSYVADTYGFLREWMDTVRADCGESGMSSQFCPAFVQYDPTTDAPIEHKGQSFGITWNCVVVTVPYALYRQTGRLDIVRDNIDNIIAYVDTLNATPLKYKDPEGEKQTDDRLTGETGTLADHLAVVTTDSVLLGNVMYYMCLNEASELAAAVGNTAKAEEYAARAEVVKQAWNEFFIDPETGMTYNTKGQLQDTQASYATALRYGIVSDENLEKVLANYVRTITEPTDKDGAALSAYTITTGFNATGNVLNALSDNGLSDVAYAMFECTDYASWLYPVTQGATSIWERWNSYTTEDGFGGNNSMNSFNHYSLGAVYEWMIGYQIGITNGEEAGYRHFVLQPTAGGHFTSASGSYESEYGRIESAWTAEDGAMTSYDVTVPANTYATLYLPMGSEAGELCNGATFEGVMTHNGADTLCYTLSAGRYHFEDDGGRVTAREGAMK